jgi:hypothetical protein
MISGGYLSLPQPLPEVEEFSERHCYEQYNIETVMIQEIRIEARLPKLLTPGKNCGIKRQNL